MIKTDAAWAAGFYDGEGCTSYRQNRGRIYATMNVSQSDARVLQKWVDIFGGKIVKAGNAVHAVTYGRLGQIIGVLGYMWPWLSEAKKEQAQRVFSLISPAVFQKETQ